MDQTPSKKVADFMSPYKNDNKYNENLKQKYTRYYRQTQSSQVCSIPQCNEEDSNNTKNEKGL